VISLSGEFINHSRVTFRDTRLSTNIRHSGKPGTYQHDVCRVVSIGDVVGKCVLGQLGMFYLRTYASRR
jgi:hypothetical protein